MLDESVNVVLCLFSTVRRNNPPAPWSMGGRRVSMLDNRSILNSIRMSLHEALQEQERENSKLLLDNRSILNSIRMSLHEALQEQERENNPTLTILIDSYITTQQ